MSLAGERHQVTTQRLLCLIGRGCALGHIITGYVTPCNMSPYHRPCDTPQLTCQAAGEEACAYMLCHSLTFLNISLGFVVLLQLACQSQTLIGSSRLNG